MSSLVELLKAPLVARGADSPRPLPSRAVTLPPFGADASSEGPALLTRERPLVRALRDGTWVRLRLIDARDRDRLRAGFDRLSAESRYRRFFTPTPRLTESMLRRLMDTDGLDRVAIGAERGGFTLRARDGLGVARFIRDEDEPDTAEIAIAIIDDVQGRGLGGLLMKAIARAARDRGIRRFRAYVLPENEPMKSLLYALDPDAEHHMEDGLQLFELNVPDVDLDKTGVSSSMTLLRAAVEGLADVLRRISPRGLVRLIRAS